MFLLCLSMRFGAYLSLPICYPDKFMHSRRILGVRARLEGKQRTPLSSRVATGVSWSPLSTLPQQASPFYPAVTASRWSLPSRQALGLSCRDGQSPVYRLAPARGGPYGCYPTKPRPAAGLSPRDRRSVYPAAMVVVLSCCNRQYISNASPRGFSGRTSLSGCLFPLRDAQRERIHRSAGCGVAAVPRRFSPAFAGLLTSVA